MRMRGISPVPNNLRLEARYSKLTQLITPVLVK